MASRPRAPAGFAPTLIPLIGIPATKTSANPARSTGPALFVGGWALAQLRAFQVGPIAGGLAAGGFYRVVLQDGKAPDLAGR